MRQRYNFYLDPQAIKHKKEHSPPCVLYPFLLMLLALNKNQSTKHSLTTLNSKFFIFSFFQFFIFSILNSPRMAS